MGPDGPDLDSIADELYALPGDEFVPRRNERAKQARAAKDRELAAAITALRRPSTSAWVVNLLARERRDLVEQLLELAEALRSAQETLSGPELRALSAQRHRVVASIVTEARKLAAARGIRVSDPVERELEATFDAALADPAAADAVSSGRLESALSYAGLGAAPTGATTSPPRAASTPAPTPKKRAAPEPDRDAARREQEQREQERREQERRAAEQVVHEAEAAAGTADDELTAAREAQDRAAEAQQEAQHRVERLTGELEQAQVDLSERTTDSRERKRAAQRAEQKAAEARRRLDRARAGLDAAGG